MSEISELSKLKINGKENPGTQEKKNKPGMPANVTIEHHEEIINFLHRVVLT